MNTTERIVDVLGIPGYWNLVWIIPACIGIGIVLAAFWPFGKGPEGPPYVGFDPGTEVTGRAYYRPGDPPGTYNIMPGSELHAQVESYHNMLLKDVNKTWDQHPGQACTLDCWRKPDGHRWGES